MSILAIFITIFFLLSGAFALVTDFEKILTYIVVAALSVIIYELGRILEILDKK